MFYANKRKEGVAPSSAAPQAVILLLNYNRHNYTHIDQFKNLLIIELIKFLYAIFFYAT